MMEEEGREEDQKLKGRGEEEEGAKGEKRDF